MHNISAYDSAFGYPGRNGKSTAFKTPPGRYRTDGYATDWLNQATVVPFLRSLAPSKLLVDTEVHTFSAMKCAFVQRTMHGFASTPSLAVSCAGAFEGRHLTRERVHVRVTCLLCPGGGTRSRMTTRCAPHSRAASSPQP